MGLLLDGFGHDFFRRHALRAHGPVFFFAFLPQFVDVSAGSVGMQILFLGTLLVTMGIVTDGAYAIAAGTLGDWLKNRPRVVTAQRWFAGGVFISLGLATALSGTKD